MNWEIFGFIASICFIGCGIPQVFDCIKNGHGRGISALFIWVWLVGELSLLVYAALFLNFNIPLLANATFCTLICLVILKYIYFPKRSKDLIVLTNFFKRR